MHHPHWAKPPRAIDRLYFAVTVAIYKQMERWLGADDSVLCVLVQMTSLELAHRCLRLVCKAFRSVVDKTYPVQTTGLRLDGFQKALLRSALFTEKPFRSYWMDVDLDDQGYALVPSSDGFVEAFFADGRPFDGLYQMICLGSGVLQPFSKTRPTPDPSWWSSANLLHITPILPGSSLWLYAPGEHRLRCKLVIFRPGLLHQVLEQAARFDWKWNTVVPFTDAETVHDRIAQNIM